MALMKMPTNAVGGGIDIANPTNVIKYSSGQQTYTADSNYKLALVLSMNNDVNYDTYDYVNYNGTKQGYVAYNTVSTPALSCTIVAIDNVKSGDTIYCRGFAMILLYA